MAAKRSILYRGFYPDSVNKQQSPVNRFLPLFLTIILCCGFCTQSWSQNSAAPGKSEIEYETIYDDPYDLHKMWIHFYPLYADVFSTNFNVGYGAQINYFYKDKFDFRLHGRRTYAQSTDFSRDLGDKNSTVDNTLRIYKNFEIGGTYHIVDKADAGESKIVVYTKRYSTNKWAATVPEFIMVPSKVRKIMGVRTGGFYWESATNLSGAMIKQDVLLTSAQGDTLSPSEYVYGNVQSAGFYLGGSMSRMRNLVVKPKKYDVALNDVLLTMYADIIYAPLVKVEDVRLNKVVYSVDPIRTRSFGLRAGIEGIYNREFSWSWGAEMGYRPSIAHRGFYAMFKVGFAFASKLQQQRTSYQSERTLPQ
jgi:hypothetical protein